MIRLLKYILSLLMIHAFTNAGNAQPFSFITVPVNRVAAGSGYRYTFTALDSMGGAIQYTVQQRPAWLQYNAATNTLSGTTKKAGQYAIQLTASIKDTVIAQHFMLTVYDQQTMNILPLGNSLTNGTSVYNSYRRSLWQLLHQNNYNIDFIGSWNLHHGGGNVPDPDFDMDHDGHSGWTAHDILQPPAWDEKRGNLDQWLCNYRPDIVLLELGTNEVFQCTGAATAMQDLSRIVDKIREKNTQVKFLLAQIPPLGNQWAPKKLCGTDTAYGLAIIVFNKAILAFAKEKTTARSPVMIVDQYTGVDPAINMYDDIHPNDKGEKEMALRWYHALQPFLSKLK